MNQLKELRKILLDYDKTEVSENSGVSRSAIESWIYSNRQPSLINFVSVLNAVGKDIQIVDRKD